MSSAQVGSANDVTVYLETGPLEEPQPTPDGAERHVWQQKPTSLLLRVCDGK